MSHYRPKDGKDGLPGTHGKDGLQGDKGDIGPMPSHDWVGTNLRFEKPDGEWGEFVDLEGEKGEKGDSIKGDQGNPGPKGDKGDPGQSVRGPKGDKGDKGNDGDQGDTGPMPEHQWQGTSLRFELPSGQWGKFVDLKGPTGTSGSSGGGGSINPAKIPHNDLGGLQGGTVVEYYHLTASQHSDLTALAALGNGFPAHTGTDTWSARTHVSTSGSALVITNGDGVSGNPSYALSTALTSLSSGGTTGQFWRGDNAWSNILVGSLRLQSSGGVIQSFFPLDGGSQFVANSITGSNCVLSLEAQPADATSMSFIRYFRTTNTTGQCRLEVFLGNNTTTANHILAGKGSNSSICQDNGNLAIFGMGSFGNGVKVLSVANATTVPTANPTGGVIIYAEGGAAKCRGTSGTVTTFGPAAPHCNNCGSDFVNEWENGDNYLAVCMNCYADGIRYFTRVKGSWPEP